MEQVAKLRLLRRLIDHGFRPGKIVAHEIPELERLLRAQSKVGRDIPKDLEVELLQALRSRDPAQLRDYLSHQLIKMGLQSFILDFLQHANVIVGDAWVRGQLEIHEEHLFTEQVQGLVRQAIGNLREPTKAPRILLTTPPEETHTLGILMVEAMLRLENVDAVCYGAQMPVRDVAQAVSRHKMNIVAVSFSASYPASNAVNYLEELRFKLPLAVDIWGGGAALRSTRRTVEAVSFMHDLKSMSQAVLAWRRIHGVD